MKMICNRAKNCRHREVCAAAYPHVAHKDCCEDECNIGSKGACVSVPVRPRRKPVTVWRVYIDFDNRADARADAKCLREECWHHDMQIRGPVKVVVP